MSVFGDQTEYTFVRFIENIINSSYFTTGVDSGTADSITVLLKCNADTVSNYNSCCLLYDSAGNLLGETDERQINLTTTPTWFTFVFSGAKPTINAATDYYLGVWGKEDIVNTIHVMRHYTGGQGYGQDNEVYSYGNPEDPIDWSDYSDVDGMLSIYCTYSAAAPSNKKIPHYFNSDFVPCDA